MNEKEAAKPNIKLIKGVTILQSIPHLVELIDMHNMGTVEG
jgi:hypothetical protein